MTKRIDYTQQLTLEELCKLSASQAKKYAEIHGLGKGYDRPVTVKTPPSCATPGCSEPRIPMQHHWFTGYPTFRPICQICHDRQTAQRYRDRTNGAEWVETVADVVAHKNGFSSLTDYLNSRHPYRKYRKDYCENQDSRLGYTCTTTIVIDAQLEVDHIDGNPSNNDPENLQTLCSCCHKYKTIINEDHKTPGRKELGIVY